MRKFKIPTIKIKYNKDIMSVITVVFFGFNTLYSNEKVTLKTGVSYEIETQGGKPPKLVEEDFKIIKIEPNIIKYSKPLDYNLIWYIEFSVKNDRYEKVVIGSLEDDKISYSYEIDSVPDHLSRGKKYPWTTIKSNLMSEVTHPNTWKSFGNDEIFWMGFKLTFIPVDKANKPLVRQQWIKMFKWEVRKWLDKKAEYKDEISKHRKFYSTALSDGRKFTPSTWNGSVEFRDDDFIKLYTIAPVLLVNQETEKGPTLSWTFDAIIHHDGIYHVVVQNPNNLKEQQATVLSGKTPVRLRFFNQDDYPSMWSWLLEGGDSWVPFSIAIKSERGERVLEWVEWVRITGADKEKMLSIINPVQSLPSSPSGR